MKTPTPTPALNIPSTTAQELRFRAKKMREMAENIIVFFILVRFDYE